MTLRSTRQSTSTSSPSDSDFSSLKPIDRLLLSQAVWQLGANSWSAVAKLLSKHPLIDRPKSFFTAQVCHSIYDYLMSEAGLQGATGLDAPHAPVHLQLARKHYQARVNELHSLILAQETKYKSIVVEIDAIRAGQWDTKNQTQASGEVPEGSADKQDNAESHASPEPPQSQTDKSPTRPNDEEEPGKAEEDIVVHSAQDSPSNDEDATEQLEPPVDEPPASPAEFVQLNEEEEEEVPAVVDPDAKVDTTPEPEGDAGNPDEAVEGEDEDKMEVEELFEAQEEEEEEEEENHDEPISDPETIPDIPEPIEVETEPVSREPSEAPRRSRRRQSSVPFTTSTRSTKSHASVEPHQMDVDSVDAMSEAETQSQGVEPEQSAPQEARESRRDAKRKASAIESPVDYLRDRKRPRDDSEPLDEEEAGTLTGQSRRRGGRQTEEQLANKRFQNVISLLHSQISQHRNGTIFHNPIKNSEAPDYREIVKRPMDLKTIKSRIKDGMISNSLEFQRDIYLMFANAMMYNRPGSDIYTMAEDMMLESEENIQSFRQTEGFVRGNRL